ncbi:MscL family protein [Candidatus Micrarchaeota archaeon]|nr:MscL family protein [Candidatus Micrarchaeota archaeon]MBU1166646.1 MscL family protein [Candidatus Micrarchaeota archaeon]MBU1886603.1 MscL family protein [Candidatus Micrarchaeota archaeon]
MTLLKEFMEFLKEYKIVGLAVAFIMGVAVNDLVKSLVADMIMPFVGIIIPQGDWKTATFALGPANIAWGSFLASTINFVILAVVVFMIVKAIIKEEKVTKK